MSVTVLFLGPLRDLVGAERMELPAPLCWEGLLGVVSRVVADRLKEDRVRIAVDGALLEDKTGLMASEGQEVALLPPVSGG